MKFALAILALPPPSISAQAPPINYQSTEIHPDHTITFRYKDPGATKVMLNIRDLPKPMPMTKDASGVWTATTQPLPPAIYNYIFDRRRRVPPRPRQRPHRHQIPERHQPPHRPRRRPPTLGRHQRPPRRAPPSLLRFKNRPQPPRQPRRLLCLHPTRLRP